MAEELRENTLVQRIIETIIQVALIPMCIMGTWAQLMPAGLDAQDQWRAINFLDAGYTRTGNYMSTIIVIVCAVATIVLCWTKAYGVAVLPSILQTYTAVRVYLYFMGLKRAGEGMTTRYGLIFMLTIAVGLSPTDAEAAGRNRLAEAPACNFDRILEASKALWEAQLGKIVVEGGTPAQRTNFHTALYHTLIAPNLLSDVGERPFYSTLSLWDT